MHNVNKDEILEKLPQINEIKNLELRNNVLEMWCEFFEESELENLEDALFVSCCPDYSLIKHTRYVTDMMISIARETEKNLGWEIDWDILIASGLLHDVSKPIELAREGDKIVKTHLGKVYQHGFLAAAEALKRSLPEKIISNIITHTGNSKIVPNNNEGIILYYADMIDTDLHYFEVDKPLYIAMQK